MITLTEANRHTTNKVKKGIIEEVVRDDYLMKKLPFEDTAGIALQYVRESTLDAGPSFIDPNEVIPESTGNTTQITVALKIMATHADVDAFLASTRSDYYDFAEGILKMKAKKFKHEFQYAAWYGDDSVDSKAFDGMHVLVGANNAMQVNQGSGSTGAALQIDKLDQLLDLFIGGDPDCLHMHRTIRRRLNAYLRLNGSLITDRDDWGKIVSYYNSYPLYPDNHLTMTETISSGDFSAATGGATGSIMAVRYGGDGVFGLQNKGGLRIRKIADTLEDKDSARWRFVWWVSLGLGSTLSLGRLDGITDAAVTA